MRAPDEYLRLIGERLAVFDKAGAAALCQEFIRDLQQWEGNPPTVEAERILQALRNKRMFNLMLKVADTLIQTQQHSPKVYRQYAQALIDMGAYTAALNMLTQVMNYEDAGVEQQEAEGLVGRVYKQLYVNANNAQQVVFLKRAIAAYLDVYETDPRHHLWHGINVVALLRRAERDGRQLKDVPDPAGLARKILKQINAKDYDQTADHWDFATAAEAHLAIGDPEGALKWLERYQMSPYTDAFEINSTLRQLREVWQLNKDSEAGQKILPLLEAALLSRQGGEVELSSHQVLQQLTEEGIHYEKVYGPTSFVTYEWYKKGLERCRSVARIGLEATAGKGTGFLLRGTPLNLHFKQEFLLVTNAHVVSNDPGVKTEMRSEEAIVTFEVIAPLEKFRNCHQCWSSPPGQLDVTLLCFSQQNMERLQKLTENISPYELAPQLPSIHQQDSPNNPRIYVIGHPHGGTLQLSLQDNLLLDHEDPLVHYRTPTIGGSSGSPVFNQQWQLIGVHHAGHPYTRRLNNQAGTYQANEGIWIQRVIETAIAEQVN